MKALMVGMLALAIARPAAAQFVPGSSVIENAPLFAGSAVVLPSGGAAVGLDVAYIFIDEDDLFSEDLPDEVDLDVSSQEIIVAAAYGITDRVTVGAFLPWLRIESEAQVGDSEADFDLTGFGDLTIGAKAQFLRNSDGAVAADVSVALPTSSGDFDQEDDDATVGIGLSGTYFTEPASLHGALGVALVEDNTTLTYSAGAVFAPSARVRASVDLLGFNPEEGDNELVLGGGLRYLATRHLFVDGGVLFPLTDDVVQAALVAGITLHR